MRVEDADRGERDRAADCLGENERGREAGAIPANVLENIRPIVIAGFAKLEELVKK